MRIVVRLVFGVVAGLLLLVFNLESSNAQVPPSVGLKPSSGVAGSFFTISWSNYPTCRGIVFTWNGTTLTTVPAPNPASGSVTVQVPPSATPNTYTVAGRCVISSKIAPSAPFTVIGITTTTPVTPTTVPTTPVKKPSAPVTTPTRPVTTTPTTTTPPTTTAPPSTTDTPPTSTTSTEPGPGDLVLDHPSIQPGDKLSATGKGCEPWHTVTLTSDGDEVGTSMADSAGAFTAPVEFTRIEAGRHTVVADCGIRLTGAVDQVVTSSSGGHTGTLVVLVFFVLAGITVLRFP